MVNPIETDLTILVVDDDPVMRRLVLGGLKSFDCARILEAEDGVAAQDLLQRHRVDLVITDLMMPRLDGMGLLRWALDNEAWPVWIILSGLDTFDAAVDAIHLGAFDFLAKPPQPQKLEVAVGNALKHAQLLRERERLFAELKETNRQLEQRVAHLNEVCGILEDQSETMLQDLRRAEIIQRALLPDSPPELGHFSVNSVYLPGV